MNEFLNAVKEDLSDRRMLPFVGVALALLIGALAYVVLAGGGSGSSAPAPVPHAPALGAAAGGLAVSQVPPTSAVGETTSGVAVAHAGSSRDPFTLLPGAGLATPQASSQGSGSATGQKASAASTASASSNGSGAGSGSSGAASTPGSSGSGGSGSRSSGQSSPKQPAKPKTVYQVSVLFGEAPGGASGEASQLKPYESLKLLTPLPSKQEPLIVFRGVSGKGKLSTFTVAGETILHGTGKCLPSADQCEAIQLRAGQSEQLQYLPPGSQTVQSYELRLVSITPTEASKAALASLWGSQSRAGMQVLLSANLMAIPGLSASALAGVLVPAR